MGKESSDEIAHHGVTIRTFRQQMGLTQAQLAERWPDGQVNPQYVQRVETGKKHIADQRTLRQLGDLLDIPLWRFGLSEYDPFNPHNLPGHGLRMYQETLDVVEGCVQQTWALRHAALLGQARASLRRLNALFGRFQREAPPPTRFEARFLRLYAQAQRLNAITALECEDYPLALATFFAMLETARQLAEPATLALTLMSIGVEQERAGRQRDAVEWLEQARDSAFGASKHIAAFVNTYLMRAYASVGDRRRFERAGETAHALADMPDAGYGDGSDFVFARRSSIVAEQSLGYLKLHEPQETLDLRAAALRLIDLDHDLRLGVWIRLDWARAHVMVGELDAGADAASEFYHHARAMQSPHAISQARWFAGELERAGGLDTRTIRDYRSLVMES